MKRFFGALLALLLALSVVVPVSADPSKKNTEHFDYDYKLADCPGFEVWDHIVYDLTTIADPNGKVRFHPRGVDNVYNYDKPDSLVIPGTFSWNAVWDPSTDEVVVHGLFVHITVPGMGSVLFDSGTRCSSGWKAVTSPSMSPWRGTMSWMRPFASYWAGS